MKNSAATVDREKDSPELIAAGFFNLFELRMLLKNLVRIYHVPFEDRA